MDTTETQKRARIKLVEWAHLACECGQSQAEWMEHEEVLEYCKDRDLNPTVLEHIAHWVWKGLNRRK